MRPVTRLKKGYFGRFGGSYVPETLMTALFELEDEYRRATKDKKFVSLYRRYLKEYAGRPTPLYFAKRLTSYVGGARIFLKREDLLHTGAHKINNTLGQVLLGMRMGKRRVIAETGAGQHGVSTATVAALFGLECEVFMGEEDMRRQSVNVFKMRLLGSRVTPVMSGTKTLKDAMNEAIRDWVTNVRTTHYVIGTVAGPHPYPTIVRDFQSVIGRETRRQILEQTGKLPDHIVACVGGGSNAMGIFFPFIGERVRLVGVEAAGRGLSTGKHAASLCRGSVGVLHGTKSYVLQDADGQILNAHSISAGLDYPGVGPEHAFFKDSKQASYVAVTDREAVDAFQTLTRLEGIIPALESSHAVAYAVKLARRLKKSATVVICISGRGDKDIDIIRGTVPEKLSDV